jgi:general L-amino acid transport system permease protein
MTAQADTPTRPVIPRKTWLAWVRENLFNNWYNSLLTLALGSAAVWAVVNLIRGLLVAEYTILRVNLTLFMVGRFPLDQLWRPWASGLLLALAIGLAGGVLTAMARHKAMSAGLPFRASTLRQGVRRFAPLIGLVGVILALTETITPSLMVLALVVVLLAGNFAGRRVPPKAFGLAWLLVVGSIVAAYVVLVAFGGVGWHEWGGLHLNVFLAVAGVSFAFPLGLMLALARRSSLPAIRTLAVTYIELVRGVPLIALLLFGGFAVGFLLPEGLRPSFVTRMLIVITAFQAAYVAEVVRGGLQSLPKGQIEAGQSVGLSAWKTTRLIVLPQALRHTIPPMVGQFIALFKDTTLVFILGIREVLGVGIVVNTQPDFLGQGLFGLTLGFVAMIFWVGAYTMSREARRIERKLGVGER